MEQVRSFVAIELQPTLVDALKRIQMQLKRQRSANAVRWVTPDSTHLTLPFLGDVSSDRLASIGDAIRQGCKGHAPFRIHLSALGCFPSPHRARVLWVGLEGDTAKLGLLQQDIVSRLQQIGFAPESRPFQPHLTPGRVKDSARPEERLEMATSAQHIKFPPAEMTVHEVALMRSKLTPSGAVYSQLAAIALSQAEPLR